MCNNKRQRGAIHLFALFGLLMLISEFILYFGSQSKLLEVEQQIEESNKRIEELETKLNILYLKAGL